MDSKEQSKTTAQKGTESARKVRAMVKNIYRSANEAKGQGKKVAYFMVSSQYDEIVRAMDVNDKAPQFTLSDEDGRPVSLADFRGRNVVLYFFPKANTPG